jgi:hypothetical protein
MDNHTATKAEEAAYERGLVVGRTQSAAERERLRQALLGLLNTFDQGRAVVLNPETRGYVLAAIRAGKDAIKAQHLT